MKSRRIRGKEWGRSVWSPMFLVVILTCGVLEYLDVTSSLMFASDRTNGGLMGSALQYYIMRDGLLSVAALCIMTLAGTTLYAQDYEENAVYMRIQRIGKSGYVGARMLQTVVSTFICGVTAFLLCLILTAVTYRLPVLAWGSDVEPYTMESLLAAGHTVAYLVVKSLQVGYKYLFYGVITLGISLFLPRRKVVIAVPMILWYLNQYVLAGIRWIPAFLWPSVIFADGGGISEVLKVSPLAGTLILTGMQICLVLAVSILFYVRIRNHGIFGGESE